MVIRTGIRWHTSNDRHKIGDWAQTYRYAGTERVYMDSYRIVVALQRGFIVRAVLQKSDQDPCGRTEWFQVDEWRAVVK